VARWWCVVHEHKGVHQFRIQKYRLSKYCLLCTNDIISDFVGLHTDNASGGGPVRASACYGVGSVFGSRDGEILLLFIS
jgi:hypothetical protein